MDTMIQDTIISILEGAIIKLAATKNGVQEHILDFPFSDDGPTQ